MNKYHRIAISIWLLYIPISIYTTTISSIDIHNGNGDVFCNPAIVGVDMIVGFMLIVMPIVSGLMYWKLRYPPSQLNATQADITYHNGNYIIRILMFALIKMMIGIALWTNNFIYFAVGVSDWCVEGLQTVVIMFSCFSYLIYCIEFLLFIDWDTKMIAINIIDYNANPLDLQEGI